MKNKFNKFKKPYSSKKKDQGVTSRRKKHSEQLSLLADFVANRLSAAGVSHVVKAPSQTRRMIWFIVIVVTAMGMATMTYRVLQEYLAYPSIMRSKSMVEKELEFPAVTICPLTIIPRIFAKEAGLYYMEEMSHLLDSLPTYNVSEETKIRCIKDPMCAWSWFDDDCYCERNPCDTLYCYPDQNKSDEICACSMLLCDWNGTAEGCFKFKMEDGKVTCLCKDSFQYSLYKKPKRNEPCNPNAANCGQQFAKEEDLLENDFKEAMSKLNTTHEIAFLLKKLKLSSTDDAKDVERFYFPPISVVNNYGMPFDNMILSCHYGPLDCDRDFETLYSTAYGKCYMFNYVGDGSDKNRTVKISTQAGRDNGLVLYMQARRQDSLPLLARKLGLRIYVHNPRSIPTLTEESIDVRPGDLTSIDVSYKKINRLGSPWGECISAEYAPENNLTGLHYSQIECERHCINMEIYRRCKCHHPWFIPAALTPDRGVICETNSSDEKDSLDKCFLSVISARDEGKIDCDCSPACKEHQYDLTNSASRLNPEFFRILKKVKTLSTKDGKPSVVNSDSEFSLIGVQIFYNSFFVTHINETAIYSWESLIANIGGNMGLFLGLSIVTILEVLEFFTEIITKLITGKRDSTRSKAFVINF